MNSYPVALTGATAPVLMWAAEHEIEASALQQLRDVSELPGLHGLRVMPDVHWGNGATVGSVIAMEQALAPAAVGVDIGCGVNAVRTSLRLEDLDARDLKALRARFENTVPVGFNMHDEQVDVARLIGGREGAEYSTFLDRFRDLHADVAGVEARAYRQMGTLGGGNHFIELCTDAEDRIWITLHSGSRGVGNELAKRHISKAKELPENQDLPKHLRDLSLLAEEIIDGRHMIVTRKGAISAKAGELALIPGSMATGSYIVRGLGNPASFQSASHGAGRKMSRSAAKRTFTVADVERTMTGIEARTDAGVIDEISLAYKDLDSVIAAESDLVEVVQKLDTILCVKG